MRNHTILTTSPNSQVTGEICIANGDGCDPFEELPLPWDQSWESTVSVAGLSLGATGGSDPAQIIQRHSAFVDGMANVYDILLSLRYLTPPGVQKPPHVSPKSAVAAAKLNSLGLEPENVELMRHLPYFRSDCTRTIFLLGLFGLRSDGEEGLIISMIPKIVSRTLLLHCALSVPRSQWHIVWLAISNSTIAFKASHMTPGLTLYIPMVLSHCSQKP